ncbi:hypothetical protein H1R20_g15641, partial [Candolleomyces eurysporus]
MTWLHDFFHAKNFQGFQRLLDGLNEKKASNPAGPSTSGGRSWNRPGSLASSSEVNSRDWLGRSVLHLAAVSTESIEYLKALLKHPAINVNLADSESQWTPLHRALYHANIPAACLLLQRSDLDINLKDKEGYTAFDVYNSTNNGTKPDINDKDAELFTWGANRNAALGLGDANDRVHPDKVVLHSKEDITDTEPLAKRFSPVFVKEIQMSKLHTGTNDSLSPIIQSPDTSLAVITSESSENLRVCGFGSGGRLGRGQQMQYDLNPLPQFDYTIVAVALGQDHTLAVTKAGEILSWGLNRFSQLGYVVETTPGKFVDEPIQTTPKKILNPLRKEVVIGVAACKTASACWTAEEVYTWGTNHGQLGYDKHAHPVQVLPRIVTKFSMPIVAMSLTDNVMACLLRSQQVECVWNDRHYRINFPIHAFPSEIQPYRPPQAIKASHIAKLVASENLIAALSSNGEVFTFSSPTSSSEQNVDSSNSARHPFQPQRIWALRKKFSSVKDVAIGSDGSIIVCTESGHVYVRIRNTKGAGKNFKFQRIQYLQRITHVSANSTGAFGALRVDFKARPIHVEGNSLAQDLGNVQPFLAILNSKSDGSFDSKSVDDAAAASTLPASSNLEPDDDEEQEDADIEQDIAKLRDLIRFLKREHDKLNSGTKSAKEDDVKHLPQGADTLIRIGGFTIPVHRVILASRSPRLLDLFHGTPIVNSDSKPKLSIRPMASRPGPGLGVNKITVLSVKGVNPLSVLVLVHYLYSDEVLAIWDRRINVALATYRLGIKVDAGLVKSDLQTLAGVLDLQPLQVVLQAPVKRVPSSSLPQHFGQLFEVAQNEEQQQDSSSSDARAPEALRPDVVLEFKDRNVWTHSTILRCRSAFFAGMFGSEEWTERRWSAEGVLRVEFRHLRWHVMQYVMRFMVCGEDREIFEVLAFAKTADDVLEFMFEVMAAATELLLDRLLLICSSIILSYLNIHNCCYILAEATHYHALQLIDRVQEYMAANLESLLESGFLDDLPNYLLQQLSTFIATRQSEKSSFTRTPVHVDSLLAKHWDWLSSEDIPTLIVRTLESINTENKRAKSARKPLPLSALPASPPLQKRASGDDLFAMDGVPDSSPSAPQEQLSSGANPRTPSKSTGLVWKVADAPRVDMKTVMAEAEVSNRSNPMAGPPKYSPRKASSDQRYQAPPHQKGSPTNPFVGPSTPTRASSIARNLKSPWRTMGEPVSASPAGISPLPPPGPQTPAQSSGLSATRPPALVKARSPGQPQKSSASEAFPSLLGPVITPTKQSSKAGASIRSASGKAWTIPPPEPVNPHPDSISTSPTGGAMSFAAIQRAQEEHISAGPSKDSKRSLRDIQQEEAEMQQEADFLKWWEEEEERVKKEMAALESYQNQHQNQRQQQHHGGGKRGGKQPGQQGSSSSGGSKRKGKGPGSKQGSGAGGETEQSRSGKERASGQSGPPARGPSSDKPSNAKSSQISHRQQKKPVG